MDGMGVVDGAERETKAAGVGRAVVAVMLVEADMVGAAGEAVGGHGASTRSDVAAVTPANDSGGLCRSKDSCAAPFDCDSLLRCVQLAIHQR